MIESTISQRENNVKVRADLMMATGLGGWLGGWLAGWLLAARRDLIVLM